MFSSTLIKTHPNQPDHRIRLVDTNAMKWFERNIFAGNIRPILPFVVIALLLVAFSMGCRSEEIPGDAANGSGIGSEAPSEPIPVPSPEALLCPDCDLVDVIEVIDANTVRTSIGDIQMYAAFVIDKPADCAELALERLTALAGSEIRIKSGPPDTVRNDSDHYYLFTADGLSIEEQLVREGLALLWTQDGEHLGWFLFRYAEARNNDAGCLWKGFQAFQRGEPSDFRVPGLSYPESG